MRTKIVNNVLISFAGAFIVPLLLWEPLERYCWQLALGMFLFLFCLGAFYGDDEFNITTNWSTSALKIKNVIGGIFAVIFFISAVLFMIGLIYVFHNQYR